MEKYITTTTITIKTYTRIGGGAYDAVPQNKILKKDNSCKMFVGQDGWR